MHNTRLSAARGQVPCTGLTVHRPYCASALHRPLSPGQGRNPSLSQFFPPSVHVMLLTLIQCHVTESRLALCNTIHQINRECIQTGTLTIQRLAVYKCTHCSCCDRPACVGRQHADFINNFWYCLKSPVSSCELPHFIVSDMLSLSLIFTRQKSQYCDIR